MVNLSLSFHRRLWAVRIKRFQRARLALWKRVLTPSSFLDLPRYRKESKNHYNDVVEIQTMDRDNVLLLKITVALDRARESRNEEMIRIWGNQLAALERRFRWKNLQKLVAGTEYVSALV